MRGSEKCERNLAIGIEDECARAQRRDVGRVHMTEYPIWLLVRIRSWLN